MSLFKITFKHKAGVLASKTEGIRSLLINYGPMVPITEEDRWGYRYALYEQGFGEDAVARIDRINEAIQNEDVDSQDHPRRHRRRRGQKRE